MRERKLDMLGKLSKGMNSAHSTTFRRLLEKGFWENCAVEARYARILFMRSDLHFATELAITAGELLCAYFRSDTLRTSRKADRSVVTEADLAADRMVLDEIRSAYPGDAILSEELSPTLQGEPRPTWVIDPLDGTTNFSAGLPLWGVSIARVLDGWPATGVVYFPLLDELYTAQKGRGAALNGQALRVPAAQPIEPIFAHCTRTWQQYQVNLPYKKRILGSAAYNLCAVARGAALLSFDVTPKVWDLAAGWLVVEEAGGVVAPLNGEAPFPLEMDKAYNRWQIPLLSAATPNALAAARNGIRPRE
jgi:myo-inositol-1(or 4)-monophosphatase